VISLFLGGAAIGNAVQAVTNLHQQTLITHLGKITSRHANIGEVTRFHHSQFPGKCDGAFAQA
jgi:hypothetical protein